MQPMPSLNVSLTKWDPVPSKDFKSFDWKGQSRFIILLVVVVGSLSGLIAFRHAKRGKELEPLLDAMAGAKVCNDVRTGTCALELQKYAEQFDLHEAENPLFGFLFAQVSRGDRAELSEILRGAHVQIRDEDGSIYSFLTCLPGATRRTSSHMSDRAQFGIPEGRVVSTLLVGHLKNRTWFQLEGSPWGRHQSLWNLLGHVLDFTEYWTLGRNVGPLGTSRLTDRHALMASSPMLVGEACPETCAISANIKPVTSPDPFASAVPDGRLGAKHVRALGLKKREGLLTTDRWGR
eukprot:TRINITY_DN35930_c0_g1_i1.p1 TRINITY_DN35930_c0_g1~~TRINITY_DN35930_c0_g1_i1.p1  ORF type:complete len:292 (-),score=26.66 TRINITY_DN35930_c0_g1_i1:66-941(-)